MTIDLLPRQPLPMPSHPRRRDGRAPLPEPEVRARLRRSWQLSEQQVATAFGVTTATVRSWEAGRTTPTGQRRAAYAAFLSGLAQGLAPARLTDQGPAKTTTFKPKSKPEPRRRTPAATPAPIPSRAPAPAGILRVPSPLGERAARTAGLPVAGGPDPVSVARRRRFRLAVVAAGVWLTFVHLMITTGPAQARGSIGGEHATASAGRHACSCAAPDRP